MSIAPLTSVDRTDTLHPLFPVRAPFVKKNLALASIALLMLSDGAAMQYDGWRHVLTCDKTLFANYPLFSQVQF